jgi:hypothetical protein
MPPKNKSDEQPASTRLPEGWKVISNPVLKLDPQDDELKKLIQDQQRRTEPVPRKKYRRSEPPDAA